MIDLTTTTRVKAFLGAGGTVLSTAQDTVIGQLISMYSARFEKELGREIETTERTEQYDVEEGQRLITLRAFPVVSVESIRNDLTRLFDASAEIESDLFYVDMRRGTIAFDWTELLPGPGTLLITYTAGMTEEGATDPTASFVENYPDLAMAVDMQVAETLRRKDRLGATNLSFQGGGVGYEAALKLLPEVRAALDSHRRVFAR